MSPYREAAPDPVEIEMREAVALLWRWRRYAPCIAGGSLWAWAAGRRARDVDLFLHSTWVSRRNIGRHYGPSVREEMGLKWQHDGYDRIPSAYPIDVYRAKLDCGTPVDLVLNSWKHHEAAMHFDYWHCMVAFSLRGTLDLGVDFYRRGQLNQQHEGRCRSREVIEAKLQPTLWGQEKAVPAMHETLGRLKTMLAEVRAGVEWVDED